eukprot:Clim_evm1s68 gene=Clim_evmTU1s68
MAPNSSVIAFAPLENGVTPQQLAAYNTAFVKDSKNALAMNVVCNQKIDDVVLVRERVIHAQQHQYSVKIPKEAKCTSQKQSGRCWIFACMNTMRLKMMKEYGLEDTFELSQTYLFFYDKLERSNYFLNAMIESAGEDRDSRMIQHMLADPINDGGQYDMLRALIVKYGVMPKSAFPESQHSCLTRPMNSIIVGKLREFTKELRDIVNSGAGVAKAFARKEEMMHDIYKILSITLGAPPATFDWSYRDSDKNFHRYTNLTPQQFYKDFVKYPVENMVSVIHDPRNEYNKTYTVKYLGNVWGGMMVKYLNCPIDTLKEIAIKELEEGLPVWFGCDVNKFLDRKLGAMDLDLKNYKLLYDVDFCQLSKADRLQYGQSLMTHAMVFTGVDLDENKKPKKWRVENSWGTDNGDSGYFSMTDDWFNEYMYQVVVDKTKLPAELQKAFESEVVELPPWDPMGALACRDCCGDGMAQGSRL